MLQQKGSNVTTRVYRTSNFATGEIVRFVKLSVTFTTRLYRPGSKSFSG